MLLVPVQAAGSGKPKKKKEKNKKTSGFALSLQRVKHLTRSHPGAPTPALPPPSPSPSAGWCQSRNLLISSSPRQPSACLDSWPSAAEPAGAGMCESHVSLLPTVGKCCSSELAAAALPQSGRAPGQTGAGARSPRRRAGPLPAPGPAGDKEHLSPRRLQGLWEGWGRKGCCLVCLHLFPQLCCWCYYYFFFRRRKQKRLRGCCQQEPRELGAAPAPW